LESEIDVSRGDLLIGSEKQSAIVADKFIATVVWMDEKALTPGRQYTFKLATRSVSGSIALIHHRIDVNTLEHHDAFELQLNEIGSCTVTVNAPVVFDAYKANKGTGAFIIIDRLSNRTVGAGMISGESDTEDLPFVSKVERAARYSQKAIAIALKGSTSKNMAYKLERKLFDNGHATTVLETQNSVLMGAIKDAGLICLCVNYSADLADLTFDADNESIDAIYSCLKDQKIIY
jgi:bifunctional enzyme CysN/CysC